jgi:hypothetical protein
MDQRNEDLKRIRNILQHLSYSHQRIAWQRAEGNEERLHDLIGQAVESRTVTTEETSSTPLSTVDTVACKICNEELILEGESSVEYDCGHSFHFACTSRYLSERMQLDMTYLLDCPTCSADKKIYPQLGKLYLYETDRIKERLDVFLRDETGEGTSTIESWKDAWNRYFHVVEDNVLSTARRMSFTCNCSESSEVYRVSSCMLCCRQCDAEYCNDCSIRTSRIVEYHAPFPCDRCDMQLLLFDVQKIDDFGLLIADTFR